MELREALYIYTVAKYKNITKAADELLVSQPSLSKYISQLESSLGVQLFSRVKNHLTLTYAGEIYAETAKKILLLNNQLEKQMRDIQGLTDGRVVVGIPASIGVFILPKILPEFKKKFPNIRVDIKEANSRDLEESLLNSDIDFAIMHRVSSNPQFQYRTVTADKILLVCSHESSVKLGSTNGDSPYPLVTLEQFKDMDLVLIKKGGWLRTLIDNLFEKNGSEPKVLFETSNIFTAYLLACNGFGATIVPESVHKFIYNPDASIFSFDSSTDYGLVVCSVSNGFLSKASEAFITTFLELFDV